MPATPLKLSERQAAALSGETTLKVLSASSDLTLLVDENDTIREVSASHDDPRLQTAESWIGRRWTDVVTPESRPKVERMLAEARERGSSARARQVNHPSPDGVHIPLLYSAVELGGDADVIAVARDMGPLAQMQQRLVTAQQALERDYARLMEMERRYRTLFATTSNGVVMVEATSGEILEANPAAVELLAPGALRISGRRFPEGFDRASAQALASAMETARSGGAVQDLPARLLAGERPCRVSMHLFQEAGAAILLVRITPVDEGEGAVVGERARLLADCLQGAPDGFVAVGGDGRILHANAAFVSMVEAAGEEAVRRQPLDTYLGRSSVDVEVLLSALKEGSLRSYATLLRGEHGRVSEVEIGAVRLADRPATGVFVHDMARRLPPVDAVAARPIPDFTTALVGRQPLKAIVAQTADAIEQLCIEKALALTGDNRAAAAELLGLSRQTLYAKLRRLGFEVGGED